MPDAYTLTVSTVCVVKDTALKQFNSQKLAITFI